MSKNLIFCADGTWNKPGEKEAGVLAPTNVSQFYDALVQDARQTAHYDDGVGADGINAVKLFEGATGAGLDEKVMDGYQFLMNHFQEGDRIFLFGFSRGAYTVRSLGQMLAQCGLLPVIAGESSVNERLRVQNAYAIYRQNNQTACTAFKQDMKCDLPVIQMIGVWDTVGALGIPMMLFDALNHALFSFHDNALDPAILYGYQALAIDEERKSFIPSIWDDREGIEQVWFTGAHSDVGGGYAQHGLSDITLRWMMEKALSQGVLLQDSVLSQGMPIITGDPLALIHMPWEFPPFNLFPVAKRIIPENSKLHKSVEVRLLNKTLLYQPANLPLHFTYSD